MSGLFQRALEIKTRHLRLLKPDEEEDAISSEERNRILTEINSVVARNRIEIGDGTFRYTPQKRGALLPILINAACVVVVVLGAFLISLYFNRRERSILSGTEDVLTVEGKLVEVLKQESEERLEEKDRQISEIQGSLAEISREQEKIRLEAQASILERESQLKAELASLLEAERTKLAEQGLSDADILSRLSDLEVQKQRELDERLADARRQADVQLAEKEDAIRALEQQYTQTLEQTQRERQRLKEEISEREAELRAVSEEAREGAESEAARVRDELSILQTRRQEEQLVLDQITAAYETIRTHVIGEEFDAAIGSLDDLGGFLIRPDIAGLPAVERRNSADRFIIGSLRDLVQREKDSSERDVASLIESADMLSRVAEDVRLGDDLFGSGDFEGARRLYLAAIGQIPSVSRGYEKLRSIDSLFREVEAQALLSILGEADSRYNEERYAQALESYEKALAYLDVDSGTAALMLERIADAGFRVGSASQTEVSETVDRLREELETARGERDEGRLENRTLAEQLAAEKTLRIESETQSGELERQLADARTLLSRTSDAHADRSALEGRLQALRGAFQSYLDSGAVADASQEALLELLEIKLLLRQVVGSEEVRAQYPTLYGDMDDYLDALGLEQRREGYAETLRGLTALLEAAASEEGEAGLEAIWARYAGESELFLMLFETLQDLLK